MGMMTTGFLVCCSPSVHLRPCYTKCDSGMWLASASFGELSEMQTLRPAPESLNEHFNHRMVTCVCACVTNGEASL
jgi:hypothetical protein